MKLASSVAFAIAAFTIACSRAFAQSDRPTPVPAAPAPIFTPVPTPVPSFVPDRPLTYSGNLRAFEFYRTNRVQNASNPNRQAFNFGGSLHLEYRLDKNWYIGGTYAGAYPFGLNGSHPGANGNVDNSLPGFAVSTFDETYLGYSDRYFQARIGDQVINTPWANSADSRIKPAAFQGAEFSYKFAPGWTAMFYDMFRFESRTSSAFGRYTLLTAPVPGASNALAPSTAEHDTSGFVMGGVTFQPGKQFALEAMDYDFASLASLFYVQAQWNFAARSSLNPSIGFQYADETRSESTILGGVASQAYGVQLGATLAKDLTLAAGSNYLPWHSTSVPLGSCAAPTYLNTGLFLPAGGTPSCVPNGNGTATIYYGGFLSPYTDSYASDPLYTTSISQGMVDRRSAGWSNKVGLTWQPFGKRLRLITSEAWYNYGNPAGPNLTREFDADATYFFSKIRPGPYHGLSVRYRYADRTQPTLPFDFKYNRAQLEYDF